MKFSEWAIIKMLDKKDQTTLMLKLKFVWNLATLDVANTSLDKVIFHPKEIILWNTLMAEKGISPGGIRTWRLSFAGQVP